MKRKESNDPSAWFARAEADWKLARRALEAEPLPELACYHAQQCAEKYLKGFLKSRGLRFRRSHDLRYLVDLCSSCEPGFKQFGLEAEALTRFAEPSRYPVSDEAPQTVDEALKAIEIAQRIRLLVLSMQATG